jgi:hypothetical protein
MSWPFARTPRSDSGRWRNRYRKRHGPLARSAALLGGRQRPYLSSSATPPAASAGRLRPLMARAAAREAAKSISRSTMIGPGPRLRPILGGRRPKSATRLRTPAFGVFSGRPGRLLPPNAPRPRTNRRPSARSAVERDRILRARPARPQAVSRTSAARARRHRQ